VPTYSYACTACEHQFDTVQKFTDPSLTDCPQCSGRLRKLFSSVGIVFKGSGFYRTDSRVPDSEKAASNGANGKSESGSPDKPSQTGRDKPLTPESKSSSGSKTTAQSTAS
jgi:putative FmdB family regulatory protein